MAVTLPEDIQPPSNIFVLNEVYAIGGYPSCNSLYKRSGNGKSSTRLANMHVGREWIQNSSVECDGSFWVFGGADPVPKKCLKSVERYDPNEEKWIEMP